MPESVAQKNSLYITLGELLAQSKISNEQLASLAREFHANSESLATLRQATTGMLGTVTELNQLVRTGYMGAPAMTTQLRLLQDELGRTQTDLGRLDKRLEQIDARIKPLEDDTAQGQTSTKVVWWVIAGVAWAITTGIALYAVLVPTGS